MRLAIVIALIACPALADQRTEFLGTWGTDQQCAGAPIKPGGTVLAEPYEIRPGWLRQGQIWCRLHWWPVESREAGLFTGADAVCGEDAVRHYRLRMALSEGELTLRWAAFNSVGPLRRCESG